MNNKNRLRCMTIDEHGRGPVYNRTNLTYNVNTEILKTPNGETVNIPGIHDLINKSGYNLDYNIIYIRDEHFVCDYRIVMVSTEVFKTNPLLPIKE